jgi:2-hydroxychromene-2-carboxylate isomerase
VTDTEFRSRILAAFGLTEEEMAAFEALPSVRAQRQAEDDAARLRAAFVEWAVRESERLSDEFTTRLREEGLV